MNKFTPTKKVSRDCNIKMATEFLSSFGDAVTIQIFDDKGKLYPKHFPLKTIETQIEVLKKINDEGYGIFFMVNEGDGKGRSQKNVTAVRAFFVDLDGAPLGPVQTCSLRPNWIIESSPDRYHCYWLVENAPIDDFRRIQKELIKRFNGDKVVHDLPRVMRVPGFYHLKHQPFMTKVIEKNV